MFFNKKKSSFHLLNFDESLKREITNIIVQNCIYFITCSKYNTFQ